MSNWGVAIKDILYAIGKTSLGQLVHATDAAKHTPYSCLCCDQPFILRQGQRKRPHFAHKALTTNCTPETALHHGFKTLLFERIQHHIEQRSPLEFEWKCDKCHGSHRGNLIKKAASVALEHSLGSRTPDIALLNEAGNPVAVIEVVVTHAPDPEAMVYYGNNNIPVILYALRSDTEMNRIDYPILQPDSVSVCLNPKCPDCGYHKARKRLLIIDTHCWKCTSPMKAAITDGEMLGVDSFSPSDVTIAAQHGVLIKSQYSKTLRGRYLANTCRECGAFIGGHYLQEDYMLNYGYIDSRIEVDAGYFCFIC